MSGNLRLQRAKFPMCCGATILYGFGNGFHSEKPTREEIEAFLRIDDVILDDKTDVHLWHEMKRNAFHMAILSRHQHTQFHDIFIRCGFEMVAENHNGHSGSNNYLYVRKVEQE